MVEILTGLRLSCEKAEMNKGPNVDMWAKYKKIRQKQ